MDRYMVHLKNSGYVPSDAKMLLAKADELTSDMHVIIRDMRVSNLNLEYDISVKEQELEKILEKLRPIGELDNARHVVEEKMEKEYAIKKAIDYFDEERFWECHEVLEGVWKKTFEAEKDLVQGIILVAAALVHFQKYENDICLSIFGRALDK